jgi:hypothetical protein
MKEYLPLVLERRKIELDEQENNTVIDIDDLQIDTPTRVPLTSFTSNAIILSDNENDNGHSGTRRNPVSGPHSTAQTILKSRQTINARGSGPSLNALFCKTKNHPSKSEMGEYLRQPLGMFYYNCYYR